MAEFSDMEKHVDHEISLTRNGFGEISLCCDDCGETLEMWMPPVENTWHGKEWEVAIGGEPEIHP